MSNFEKVADFMQSFKQDVETVPQWASVAELRYSLIHEELQ